MGVLWALDWQVLRFLMMGKSIRKSDLANYVLSTVPLLAGLTEEQRDVLASEMQLVESVHITHQKSHAPSPFHPGDLLNPSPPVVWVGQAIW